MNEHPNNNSPIDSNIAVEKMKKFYELEAYMNKVSNQQSFSDFLTILEDYNPIIPEAVINHFMKKGGVEFTDKRLLRLISVASQKFLSDIVNDALQHCKMKSSVGFTSHKGSAKDTTYTLNMEDLASACSEYGINVKKAPYFM